MLDKYGKDGLVVIGVTLDDSKEKAASQSAFRYLQKQKVPFPNVNLEGDDDSRPAAIRFTDATPRVFVFDRDNRTAERLPTKNARGGWDEVDYDAIEKRVAELVKKGAR